MATVHFEQVQRFILAKKIYMYIFWGLRGTLTLARFNIFMMVAFK